METTSSSLVMAAIESGQEWGEPRSLGSQLFEWGPVFAAGVFIALVLFLLVRGWLQGDRYRAQNTLGEAERGELESELEGAEQRTTGEIMVVVVERSDRHPAAHWIAGVFLLMLGTAVASRWMPWEEPALFFAVQLGLGVFGALAALAVPGFRRCFVTEARATETAEEQAFQEFYRHGLQRTVGATGVLLFVSLFERRVIVLGDEGIDARLEVSHWEAADAAILAGIRKGDLKQGLVDAIRLCSEVLEEHFPADGENPNELPNHVIVRAE